MASHAQQIESQRVSIPLNTGDTVSGILSLPISPNPALPVNIVLAHGAANDMNNPLICALAQGFALNGFSCLRFNFLYREKGKKSVDPEHRLVHAWDQAIKYMKKATGYSHTIAMGKSLGARIAAQATAAGQIKPDQLIFLGYPLHAPGKKDKLRDAHLYEIKTPMLFFEGTRDPFCDLDQLDQVLKKLTCPADLMVIEGANHSFDLPKADPRKEEDIHGLIIDKCLNWMNKMEN